MINNKNFFIIEDKEKRTIEEGNLIYKDEKIKVFKCVKRKSNTNNIIRIYGKLIKNNGKYSVRILTEEELGIYEQDNNIEVYYKPF